MEIIKINSVEDVQTAYAENNVNPLRVQSLNDKFQTIPDEFTVHGLCFPTLKINGEDVPNVPSLSINTDGTKFIPVGTFKQSYTDKTAASQITKEGTNKGKFLVVNNKRVHSFSEGLSEAELVAFLQGKSFKAAKAKEYPVFQPNYVDRKPVYPNTEEEALAMVKPKSFRSLSVK